MLETPEGIGSKGLALWRRIWADGITWISPDTDLETAERACRLVDDLDRARTRYHATGNPADGRMVVAFSKELGATLGELGFSPVSRARLGVAEVTRVSKLDALRRSRDA